MKGRHARHFDVPWRWFLGVLACCLLVVGVGCSDSVPSVQLAVTPGATRMDEPVAIQVSQLEPGASVEVELRSVDAGNTTWTSRATFTADQDGVVDPGQLARTAGSYLGVSRMGLLTVMNPAPASAQLNRCPSTGGATFEVSAHQGDQTLATASLTRTFWTKANRPAPSLWPRTVSSAPTSLLLTYGGARL